jgi:hypothetical protein
LYNKELEEDIDLMGSRWKDDFLWDVVSRKAESMRARIMWGRAKPWVRSKAWSEASQTDLGETLRERFGEEIEAYIRQAHRKEWDYFVKQNLSSLRRRNKAVDIGLALLIDYNEDIDEDERVRRWEAVKGGMVEPQGWHD